MKSFIGCLPLIFTFVTTTTSASSPTQHLLNGIVLSVDLEKHILKLEPAKKDSPTEFEIVEGRTRVRRNKKPASLADLTVGDEVRLYYRREDGRFVATDVSWKTPKP